ncbi:MAG: MBOAT family protein [Lentisphaerae bacterium]|nr:MBOAT family protein [Lentisphaerota bacterium]
MVFSSSIFLFFFLPAVLLLYALTPRRLQNLLLLAASLFFYAWGERAYTAVMLVSIAGNYAAGLVVDRLPGAAARRWAVGTAVALNLALLAAFKYANFLADNLNVLLQALGVPPVSLAPVHLPIGISFFTFQSMSYVVDVYRREVRAQRRPVDLALYVALFPQLVAGPIVRYRDVAAALGARRVTRDGMLSGARRFGMGLAKKVLIANTLSVPADRIFSLPGDQLNGSLAWLGIVAYTMQIYFDFSGYSDMAIGLGRLFGFDFMENFRHPYAARSVRDFWRRWHLSLSTWFRDYVYIPLGGSRGSSLRTGVNLVLVFFLCGLWHGASWTFVGWGLFHGSFLVLERGAFGRLLETRVWRPLQHVYVMGVVMAGWTLFRAADLGSAAALFRAAAGGMAPVPGASLSAYLTRDVAWALAAGAACAGPFAAALVERWRAGWGPDRPLRAALAGAGADAVLLALVVASAEKIATGASNPFIYYRF